MGCAGSGNPPQPTAGIHRPELEPDPRQPATAGSAARATFVEPSTGVRVEYPADWERRPSADYVLLIVPPNGDPNNAQVSLDVPDLPAHIPGWIPIGMVRNGYADDLRKAHPGARVQDLPPPAVAGAKTRLVRSEWTEGSTARQETALLIVRGDHVYIVRGTSGPDQADAVRAAFDQVVRSIAWTR